jgi:succinate dehydrogenase / fumarate reductase cytochrome b subunit
LLVAAPTAPDAGAGVKSANRPIRPAVRRLPFPLNLYQTAVGKKWVMAATGLMLLGFVLFHMFGNIKLYIGVIEHDGHPIYDIDLYAEGLRELLVPIFPRTWLLWLLRFGLIGAFALHIHSALTLTRMNQTSNRTYADKRDWLAANFASRSMRYTGIIVGLYLVFHLADLTWGWGPWYDWERGAVQANVVNSLSNPGIAAIYIVANVALSVHIFHGAYSMFQSLGINSPQYNYLRRHIARALAVIILIGNVSFPIAVLTSIVEFDPSLLAG